MAFAYNVYITEIGDNLIDLGRGDAARAHEADVLGARDLEVAVVEAVEDLAEHRGALVTCRREL